MTSVSGKVHKVNTGIVTSCVVGLALSYYAWAVEVAKEKDDSYEAMCDISERVSCTNVFTSEYGKGFGLIPEDSIFYAPNSIYGLIFYSILAVTSIFNRYYHAVVLVFLATLSNFSSAYLAWILYILNDLCVVCVSTYIVNAFILILSIRKLRILTRAPLISSKKKKH
ncbi:vitamin K epoxide reductase complex subunit 1 [Venturia canescens]|uniref:vitamin K epoxide reductase complex subunit 1 n=1 Tax=Venturia canescens TaxID=32260 RepID=UPI001C9C2846|nr:vitamin K epoxide reductase complex subunit 1 [Venturia canescens]